jgi:hypothetical protein
MSTPREVLDELKELQSRNGGPLHEAAIREHLAETGYEKVVEDRIVAAFFVEELETMIRDKSAPTLQEILLAQNRILERIALALEVLARQDETKGEEL